MERVGPTRLTPQRTLSNPHPPRATEDRQGEGFGGFAEHGMARGSDSKRNGEEAAAMPDETSNEGRQPARPATGHRASTQAGRAAGCLPSRAPSPNSPFSEEREGDGAAWDTISEAIERYHSQKEDRARSMH
ncbi:hypothetical protein CXG81DRAFT_20162 [Caulochytrium protostelioides]|uniref:Uncharacterized protein n=1 Tax=Caulochytrium protostelioides TaxID=1555241 RepID=A0A4P9X452_9FUNG|nr:hypothetical protein CXG81DRAFT_20162 [Caulochytrium protostelioides]|eukprot:RKO99810.1 hypothetical protein CXG81DRAFT_20162 [Caulochytrium protostelioides]